MSSPKQNKSESRVKTPKCRVEPQFDVETGSVLSGVYDADSNPSLLDCPQGWWCCLQQSGLLLTMSPGVNLVRRPRNFSYSYPQIAMNQDREAFGDAQRRTEDWLTSSVASTPGVFTSVSE
jgi:hypothetical protein